MKYFFSLFFLILFISGFSQTVTHGPIVGAVTDSSCRVFVRTSQQTNFTVQCCTDPGFGSNIFSASAVTDSTKDTIAIVQITGLSADTKYYVRVMINGS